MPQSRVRLAHTGQDASGARVEDPDPAPPTVLADHRPLHREPTAILRHPSFALWCGTGITEDRHSRLRAVEVVYGHLRILRVPGRDGVRCAEASPGCPREWRTRPAGPPALRQILAGRRGARG
jgi:hypothetical protein